MLSLFFEKLPRATEVNVGELIAQLRANFKEIDQVDKSQKGVENFLKRFDQLEKLNESSQGQIQFTDLDRCKIALCIEKQILANNVPSEEKFPAEGGIFSVNITVCVNAERVEIVAYGAESSFSFEIPRDTEDKLIRSKQLSQALHSLSKLKSMAQDLGTSTKSINNEFAILKKYLSNKSDPLDELQKKARQLLRRFEQISHKNLETYKMSEFTRLKLAIYVEDTLPKIENTGKSIFAKVSDSVPRDVLITKKGRIYIMASKGVSLIKAEGAYKKVFAAIELPKKRVESAAPMVQAQIEIDSESIVNMTEREKAFYKELKDIPGIVKMHTCCRLDQENGYSQFRLLFDRYDSDLYEYMSYNGIATGEKIDIAKQILNAMLGMFAKGISHRDFKPENILIRKEKDGTFTVGITDFGFSTRFNNKTGQDQEKVLTPTGFYGTPLFTAPELLGDTTGTGDCRKFDGWAVGVTLYSLFMMSDPDWFDEVFDANDPPEDWKSEANKIKFGEALKEHVENRIEQLQTVDSPTPEDELEFIALNMLRPDPEKRYSLSDALNAINRIVLS